MSRSSITSTGSLSKDKRTLLPISFQPGNYTVLIGRGRNVANAVGNRRLKVLVQSYREQYAAATNRQEKSRVVSLIVDFFQEACPQGAFVKMDNNGRWWEVEDDMAREKVGAVLRDSLADKYKSSSKSKVAARRARNSMNSDVQVAEVETPQPMPQPAVLPKPETSEPKSTSLSPRLSFILGQVKPIPKRPSILKVPRADPFESSKATRSPRLSFALDSDLAAEASATSTPAFDWSAPLVDEPATKTSSDVDIDLDDILDEDDITIPEHVVKFFAGAASNRASAARNSVCSRNSLCSRFSASSRRWSELSIVSSSMVAAL